MNHFSYLFSHNSLFFHCEFNCLFSFSKKNIHLLSQVFKSVLDSQLFLFFTTDQQFLAIYLKIDFFLASMKYFENLIVLIQKLKSLSFFNRIKDFMNFNFQINSLQHQPEAFSSYFPLKVLQNYALFLICLMIVFELFDSSHFQCFSKIRNLFIFCLQALFIDHSSSFHLKIFDVIVMIGEKTFFDEKSFVFHLQSSFEFYLSVNQLFNLRFHPFEIFDFLINFLFSLYLFLIL